MQQKCFKFFLPQQAGASGTAKATPKIEKIFISNIYRDYLLYPQSNASGSFLLTCINFAEQRIKFSHFEGTIIPKFF